MLFGSNKTDEKILNALEHGAVIIDVRTPAEFSAGHAKNAKNIPLSNLSSQVSEIKKWKKPVILCCASGARSGQGTAMLSQQGIEAYNAGPWSSLA
ncbi:MAG: rhodanese-like domain-containing protein [Cytophagales bacterium]|nr:rhodanese-like domain-containing protein [Cytophagales bacterium]